MDRSIFVTTFKDIQEEEEEEEEEEVLFRIHINGLFEYDPLRYEVGSVINVSAFSCDRDIFSSSLDNVLLEIKEPKWALFFCDPKQSLENGLQLINRDDDVHNLYELAETHESVDIFVAHKPQMLAQFYLKNIGLEVAGWVEQDANFRMSSPTPFRTRCKWKGIDRNKMQASVRKIQTGKGGVVIREDKGVFQAKKDKNKGKEKLVEDEDVFYKKKGKAVVTTYKRGFDAMGKAMMVECAGYGDVENRSGGAACLVPSGDRKPFKSSEKITNCVLALAATRPCKPQ